ncbi:MAG: M23 family metallopeptidase [Candidatus Acidiferrales bacterium]
MPKRLYTLVFAHDISGRMRKLNLPGYAVNLILVAALVGVGAVLAGVASYTHLLLAVTDYNQVRAEREQLRQQARVLESSYAQTHERLTSLESLANEIAASYGLLRLRQTPFGSLEGEPVPQDPEDFQLTLARYRFLRHHATAVTLYASGVRPLPGQELGQLNYTPSLWPVEGRLTGSFGIRLDPFDGEGTFHAGVDISTDYGRAVRAAADGFVVAVGRKSGYGRVLVVDHGAGMATWYAHLSAFRAYRGQAVQRGDIIGYVGSSGRATGPHLHYEVRLWDAPLNPWRFLRASTLYTAAQARLVRGGD